MLGFQDVGALLAYLLTIASALACVVYGIINWNKPAPDVERSEIAEEKSWEAREDEIGKAAVVKRGR